MLKYKIPQIVTLTQIYPGDDRTGGVLEPDRPA